MKDSKILAKDGSSQEEEKSKLEKIEEEFKSAVFSVFYLLLKNNETSYWKFVIILIIEYIQMLSYSFDETVRFIKSLNNRWLMCGRQRMSLSTSHNS